MQLQSLVGMLSSRPWLSTTSCELCMMFSFWIHADPPQCQERQPGLTLQTTPRGSMGVGGALFTSTLAAFRSLCRRPRECRYCMPRAMSQRHSRQHICSTHAFHGSHFCSGNTESISTTRAAVEQSQQLRRLWAQCGAIEAQQAQQPARVQGIEPSKVMFFRIVM